MVSESNIKRFTAADLMNRHARGESQTDLTAVKAKSEAELDRDIAADPAFRDIPADWHLSAAAMMPTSKRLLSLRLDTEVIEWFKRQGPGYQTRMNAVLRAFIEKSATGL